jgi:hypothetical protein
VLTSSCLHAASSRSHQLFFLRLEAGQIHSRLGIFDLRSSPLAARKMVGLMIMMADVTRGYEIYGSIR